MKKRIWLSADPTDHLSRLARSQEINENQIIAKALDILFNLTELFDEGAERQSWSLLSEASLQRIWDNEEDAVYDNWRELYGVPTR